METNQRHLGKTIVSLMAILLGLLPMVVLLASWNSIPQSIPAHWFGDFIDRWGQKWELVIFPVICLISGFLLSFFSAKQNLKNSDDARFMVASLMVALFGFSAFSLIHIYLSLQARTFATLQLYGATLFYVLGGLIYILFGVIFSVRPIITQQDSYKPLRVLFILAGITILLFCGTGILKGNASLLLLILVNILLAAFSLIYSRSR